MKLKIETVGTVAVILVAAAFIKLCISVEQLLVKDL